jgi:hypothetical protein
MANIGKGEIIHVATSISEAIPNVGKYFFALSHVFFNPVDVLATCSSFAFWIPAIKSIVMATSMVAKQIKITRAHK